MLSILLRLDWLAVDGNMISLANGTPASNLKIMLNVYLNLMNTIRCPVFRKGISQDVLKG